MVQPSSRSSFGMNFEKDFNNLLSSVIYLEKSVLAFFVFRQDTLDLSNFEGRLEPFVH